MPQSFKFLFVSLCYSATFNDHYILSVSSHCIPCPVERPIDEGSSVYDHELVMHVEGRVIVSNLNSFTTKVRYLGAGTENLLVISDNSNNDACQ